MAKTKYTTPEQINAMRREIQYAKQLLTGGAGQINDAARQLRKSRALKILSWAIFLAVISLLTYTFIMVQTVKSRGEVPEILGFYLFSVESGSMEPTLNVGSVIVSRAPGHPEALAKNDIVTFKTRAGAIVTHRIIDVRTDANSGVSYRTKGDNPLNAPDEELLTPDRVIAVFVVKIPLT